MIAFLKTTTCRARRECLNDPASPAPSLLKMKYIRHRKLGFILFEGNVRHDDVAKSLGGASEVVSAGFVFTPGVDLMCMGHSSTLNIGSGPSDARDLKSRLHAF